MVKAAWVPLYLVLVATAHITGCSTAPAAVAETQPPSPVTTTLSASTPLVTTRPAGIATPTAFPSPTIAVATNTTLPAPAATPEPRTLWIDATEQIIGTTAEWTNKVELADIDGDGRVDILFANGGDYETPGTPAVSRVFLNQGSGQTFVDVSETVFGPEGRLARVIKVCELSGDGQPDIIVGTTFQTQSQLFLNSGAGAFENSTASHFPAIDASIGDLECGDADGDGDLDLALADWGSGSPMGNQGGRTMLWLNDGAGNFSDVTAERMPDVLVRFSWELEWVDVDNDYDLDLLVSCKRCQGSFLFENDGTGTFRDVSAERLPQFSNNYDFEAMDLNGDSFLDLVTINDGAFFREHLFLGDGQGGFSDATEELWAGSDNPGRDDNNAVFLDYDSDGDADVLIGALDGPERLMVNDGAGRLTVNEAAFPEPFTPGTLGLAVAHLDDDKRLDVVQAQGEVAFDEKVYLGADIPLDTAPPMVTLVEQVARADATGTLAVRARIHDHKSPVAPHDWQRVVLRLTAGGTTSDIPMQWYGEYLWRAVSAEPPVGSFTYQVCATDAAGNSACSEPVEVE